MSLKNRDKTELLSLFRLSWVGTIVAHEPVDFSWRFGNRRRHRRKNPCRRGARWNCGRGCGWRWRGNGGGAEMRGLMLLSAKNHWRNTLMRAG